MRKTQAQLPPLAAEFQRLHPCEKRALVLRVFHRWMDKWKLGITNLRRPHIESFIRCPAGKELTPNSQNEYLKNLRRYLQWLHIKGLLGFDPQCFYRRQKSSLPQCAMQYMRTLEPTRKKGTLYGHRVSLNRFHQWLDEQKISVDILRRRHMTAWMRHLSRCGNVPVTINHHINGVRMYLYWLYEQGILEDDPHNLLCTSDRVKEPQYLPRPLPPLADKQLQQRLAAAHDIYSRGLLLMRKTGLRIGELMALENNCVRCDDRQNHFLKVPLGKLNTERLVPLDDSALALIDLLKGSGRNTATKTFLIETEQGRQTQYQHYTAVLKNTCAGLETNGKMVSHRLRHTYATCLLNAGMSLVGLMKLLGHNQVAMTLRYAAITQETIGTEYFEALSRLEHRYTDVLHNENLSPNAMDPVKMLGDLARLTQNFGADHNAAKPLARSIVKRIYSLQIDIQKLFSSPTATG